MPDININPDVSAIAVHKPLTILSLIAQADLVVQLVLLILVIASIYSWTISFNKLSLFKRIKQLSEKFEQNFWSGQRLDQLYERMKNKVDHPLANIFLSAMDELNKSPNHENHHFAAGLKHRINQAMNVSQTLEIEKLESNISFLAIIGSSAPFVGLFGTVWGIMHSFQSIAAAKNATLAVVAPGIAEALFATAIGLVVAIPAGIFFNILSNKLNLIDSKMNIFAEELSSLMSRQIDEAGK